MSDTEVLDVIYRLYYELCCREKVPCAPHIQVQTEHTRRTIIMLSGIVHSQLVDMVEKEKNRG